MDEKDFKKHLRDLAHGQHHPEEHDWGPASPAKAVSGKGTATAKRAPAKSGARKTRRAK